MGIIYIGFSPALHLQCTIGQPVTVNLLQLPTLKGFSNSQAGWVNSVPASSLVFLLLSGRG